MTITHAIDTALFYRARLGHWSLGKDLEMGTYHFTSPKFPRLVLRATPNWSENGQLQVELYNDGEMVEWQNISFQHQTLRAYFDSVGVYLRARGLA